MPIIASYVTGLFRGARAKHTRESLCPQGYVLDPDTGVELCINDLVLDPNTGDLITPAEAQRRGVADQLFWDEVAEEWVDQVELSQRQRAREREQRQRANREARLERRRKGLEVFDEVAEEWVTPEELARRNRGRAAVAGLLAIKGMANRVPDLGRPSAANLQLGPGGVARLGTKPAGQALAEPEKPGVTDTIKTEWAGWQRREEEAARYRRLLIMLALGTALAVVVLTRSPAR